MKKQILVVDDEQSIRDYLSILLKREGYAVITAEDGSEAKEALKAKQFDLIISDMQMPKVTGLELLEYCALNYPETLFMIITAFGTTETAVEAMKKGAYDYLSKPFKVDEIRIVIKNALKSKSLESENKVLRRELKKNFEYSNMVGDSTAMHSIFELVKKVAQTQTNVLITGESGTGKEMIAKAIHASGVLADKPFVTVNCGAIPENLMESEMFGHKKGSFTGAVVDKKGLFQAADTGTLFLDEVGELPLNVQVKLLRALQEKTIRQVGGTDDLQVDIRIICATNRNLKKMVDEGTFREDLYYRLNVIQIVSPALRERKSDIALLARHFLKKYGERANRPDTQFSNEAIQCLQNYHFPGNVRELENIIERSVALQSGNLILPESFPASVLSVNGIEASSSLPTTSVSPEALSQLMDGFSLDSAIDTLEKAYLQKALNKTKGVKKRAAKELGITFRSIRYRIQKHGLDKSEDEGQEVG